MIVVYPRCQGGQLRIHVASGNAAQRDRLLIRRHEYPADGQGRNRAEPDRHSHLYDYFTFYRTHRADIGTLLRGVAGDHPDVRALAEIRLEGSGERRTNYAGMLPTPIQSGPGHET